MGTTISRRIYFSLPIQRVRDGVYEELAPYHVRLITALANKVRSLGYGIEVFGRLGISDSRTATTAWGFDKVDQVMRRCHGAVFIGLPRWIFATPTGEEWRLSTEYSHTRVHWPSHSTSHG
jgi:hypothetical protein